MQIRTEEKDGYIGMEIGAIDYNKPKNVSTRCILKLVHHNGSGINCNGSGINCTKSAPPTVTNIIIIYNFSRQNIMVCYHGNPSNQG